MRADGSRQDTALSLLPLELSRILPALRTPRCALAVIMAGSVIPVAHARAQQGSAHSAVAPVPLTLDVVLRSAAHAHPLVVAAEGRLRAARGQRTSAGAIPNPVFTYQVENASFPGGRATSGIDREVSTYATLPLEPLWQRGPRVNRANSDVGTAEADLVGARRAVALDAARAFHRMALSQASVAATRDIALGLDSVVRFTGARVREGAAAEGDLLRLQVEQDRVLTEQALQEAEFVSARAMLAPYLGPDTARTHLLVADTTRRGELEAVMPAPFTAGDRAASAPSFRFAERLTPDEQGTRPDVLAARSRARSAAADEQLQRLLVVRQLGATFGSKSIAGTRTMIAGLSMPIPLFDRNRGDVERARGERSAAEAELAWVERRASAEVTGAYDAARVLTARVMALQSNFLSRAEESRRVALAAYREGAVPLLQVLDATRTLGDARLTYLRARFAQQDAVLALYVAMGLDPAAALSSTPSAIVR